MEIFRPASATAQAFLDLARSRRDMKWKIAFLRAEAKKWETLPNGWTEQSAKDFWDSLTGEAKHKVTKCIEKMEGNVDDAGAFCASLADLVDPGWRSRRASEEVFPRTVSVILESWFRKAFAKTAYGITDVKVTWKEGSLSYPNGVPWDFSVLVTGISQGRFFVTGKDLESILADLTGHPRPPDAKMAVLRAILAEIEQTGLHVGLPARNPNPTLVRGRDLLFVFHLAEHAGSGRVAALDSPLMAWLGKKERLIPHVFKDVKDLVKKVPLARGSLREFQAGLTGFVQELFHELPGGNALAQKLWHMFEASSVSQNSGVGRETVNNYRRYFTGPPALQLLQAAAVALDLFRRGRMPNLMARAEALFRAELKNEMETVGVPGPAGKNPPAGEVLKKMVAERLPKAQAYLDQLPKAGLAIDVWTARTLVSDFLEDSNWHSLSGAIARMTPGIEKISIPHTLSAQVSREEDYSINFLAIMGIAILSLVRDKEGIAVLKQAVLSEFPDTFVEME